MEGELFVPRLVVQASRAALGGIVAAIEGVAFWVAVVLPVLYGPGLLLYGNGQLPAGALAGLVGVNLVALVVGHRHNRPGREATATDVRSGAGSRPRTEQ